MDWRTVPSEMFRSLHTSTVQMCRVAVKIVEVWFAKKPKYVDKRSIRKSAESFRDKNPPGNLFVLLYGASLLGSSTVIYIFYFMSTYI